MTEEPRTTKPAEPRVVARRQVGGASERRRRIFNRHLLLFLAANLGIVGADLWRSPSIDWAHWALLIWGPLFLVHMLGLKSRGYSMLELLTPPKTEAAEEKEKAPFDYELIRSRQLRDGVANAAKSVRKVHSQLADEAIAAADDLLSAVERLVAATREVTGESTAKTAARLQPELRAALDALDELHEGLISVDVLEKPPEEVPIKIARERAEALRNL